MKLRKPRIPSDVKVRTVTDYNAGLPIKDIVKRNNLKWPSQVYRIIHEKV